MLANHFVRDDISIRWWPGNIPPLQGSESGSSREFYLLHHRQPDTKIYTQCPSARFGKKPDGRYVVLYALIRVTRVCFCLFLVKFRLL